MGKSHSSFVKTKHHSDENQGDIILQDQTDLNERVTKTVAQIVTMIAKRQDWYNNSPADPNVLDHDSVFELFSLFQNSPDKLGAIIAEFLNNIEPSKNKGVIIDADICSLEKKESCWPKELPTPRCINRFFLKVKYIDTKRPLKQYHHHDDPKPQKEYWTSTMYVSVCDGAPYVHFYPKPVEVRAILL